MTKLQRDTLAAIEKHNGSVAKAAKDLGVPAATVSKRLYKIKAAAAKRGEAPEFGWTHPVPDGYQVRRVSSYYGQDGQLRGQWVQASQEHAARVEAMREFIEELCEPANGVLKPRKPVKSPRSSDMMAAYLIGDHHHGMYSWADETGADYDCKISEDLWRRAFDRMSALAPSTETAMIVTIGDLLHADNHSGVTPQSGNRLDTDSRHSHVIRSILRMWLEAIAAALDKHRTVTVAVLPGNHDPESSVWIAHALDLAFRNEPRVTVSTSPRAYQYHVFGRCLIGLTHGDRVKNTSLAEIMAVDTPHQWAVAEFRHWYTGHIHHKTVQELRGCTVESLSVLCGQDDWHARQGYRSKRAMQLDIWHKEFGRLNTWYGPYELIKS